MVSSSDKSEIAFFDVETTVPSRPGQGFAILEFGAILVCPRKLDELVHYSTLVQPANLSLISNLSVRCNGITKEAVVSAPTFSDIADKVYDILHGRIWAGHNILRFDCPRIREAFAEINRPAPEPKGTLDSLAILTQKFGRRAGDMKMASLATYFGLGQQTHRSLDDVRMNLEVLKYCATVLFLESSLPDIFTENSWVSPNHTTRSRSTGKTYPEGNANNPSSISKFGNDVMQSIEDVKEESHPILSFVTPVRNHGVSDPVEPNSAMPDAFDNMERDILLSLNSMEDEESSSAQELSPSTESEASSNGTSFLLLDEISEASISVNLAPFYRGTQKIQILHKDVPLEVCCKWLKVRFGVINSKYPSSDGRPRLSFVVDASPSLCRILDISDNHAQKLSMDSGSTSDWRPVVARKPGFLNSPTLRLNLPATADGDMVRWATEIYHNESSAPQKLIFSRFDALGSLLNPGKFVDAYFSLDTFDYQQKAGIRLVAKKLIIHQN